MDVWIIIPAYNEESVICNVIRQLKEYFRYVLVVDDGSSDMTYKLSIDSGAIVLHHAVNFGQGSALQTGIEYACINNAKYIATFDADGQHSCDDLLKMIEVIKKGHYDIVLGSRFIGDTKSNIPSSRKILLRLAVFFTWCTSGVRLTDAHNGLRVMTVAAGKKIKIQQNKMAHASELISIIKQQHLLFTEVPVTIKYTEYSLSKGQKFIHSFEIIKQLFMGKFIK